MRSLTGSVKVRQFTESVIREMTRLSDLYGGVNLSQGFPDFSAPQAVKDAACAAIQDDLNQYTVTWGMRSLCEAIARERERRHGVPVVADEQVTVCCGSTEGMMASMLALIDPGDEVIVFEPFYENYGPDAILSGATPRFVTLHEPRVSDASGGTPSSPKTAWSFDPDELAAAFNNRTKAIVINTPNNPTGKVFTREELETIAALCRKWDVVVITDEIYEHIVYDGAQHVPMAAIEGMAERTVTISGLSKSYSVTGWRVGWVISPRSLTESIRKVHDLLTVGAPAPLQAAGEIALALPEQYHRALAADYQRRRDLLLDALARHRFACYAPAGAYFLMTDISAFLDDRAIPAPSVAGADARAGTVGAARSASRPRLTDDVEFARYLVKEIGVAAVPGSSFYSDPSRGRTKLRFCFCKRDETLFEADRRLALLAAR